MSSPKKQNMADVSILLTISNTLRTAVTLVISIIAVRYMPKQSYGIYLQIMFLLNTIILVLSFGMPRSIYYFLPRVINKKKFVFHTLLVLNGLGLVALAIILLGRLQIGEFLNNKNIGTGLYFLGIYIFLLTNKQLLKSVLLNTGNGKFLAILEVMMSVLLFLCAVIPLLLGYELRGILYGMLIFFIFQYFITGLFSLKKTPGDLSNITQSECFTEQLLYILPLGLISIVAILSSSIDRLVISIFMDLEQFAIYDRGAMRIPVISVLSITVGAVIMPRLVETYKNGKINELLEVWHGSIEKVALIVFPSFIFLFVFAQEIITLLYTDSFADSVLIFRIYLFILILTITIYGNIFNIANKNTTLLIISIFSVFLNGFLSVIMVKIFGSKGPAMATVIMYLVISTINIFVIKYILNIKLHEVFPWSFLWKIMFCSIISCLIPASIAALFNLNKILVLLICFPIFLYTFYSITNAFHLLKEEDKHTIFKWSGVTWLKKRFL